MTGLITSKKLNLDHSLIFYTKIVLRIKTPVLFMSVVLLTTKLHFYDVILCNILEKVEKPV